MAAFMSTVNPKLMANDVVMMELASMMVLNIWKPNNDIATGFEFSV